MPDLADEILQAALQRIESRKKAIGSTYRLQLHENFKFRDATNIIPYLADLGITHVYASPYFKAKPGSTHGYDVTDHCQLNPELGTQADYDAFVDTLKSHGMHHILDMVPNHVGIGNNDNAWWNDVLKHGRESAYANYFDINWSGSPTPDLKDRVLLPLLGDLYAKELEAGHIQLIFDNEAFFVRVNDRVLPVSLHAESGALSAADVQTFNGSAGDARSFDRLDALLRHQHYRLAWWKTAPDEINYRRFFDINDLAGLAMERPEVFDATHKLVMKLLADDKVAGLRIDHPDGLRDPKQYFERLQRKYVLAVAQSIARERDVDWENLKSAISNRIQSSDRPLYVSVEKILALNEPLIESWPVSGTTGYEFLNYVNGLFVDTTTEDEFSRIYRDWIGSDTSCAELIYQKKKLILKISLASELNVLAITLKRIAERDRYGVDFSLNVIRSGLIEIVACFPVYRSYITDNEISDTDRKQIRSAIDAAVSRNPKTLTDVFQYIERVLTHESCGKELAARRNFAAKFQQLTAPTTAKGIEDTTFYIYNRLLSLNEVGGDPSQFGITPDALHAFLADRQQHWPTALSTLSTHDTKRSEEVRARLNVLSEIPEEWESRLTRWRAMNKRFLKAGAPDENEQYAIYQTLLGAWPFDEREMPDFEKRVQACMLKSMREAKVHTRWTDPDAEHEAAVAGFVHAILTTPDAAAFRSDFQQFQKRIGRLGIINSLSQTLIKLTAPGVPDTYQGTDLWDFSMVDPDNRRPVDYTARAAALNNLPPIESLLATPEDGRIKLAITRAALALRKTNARLFERGAYLPLRAVGELAENVFAFARHLGDQVVIVAVPRLIASRVPGAPSWPIGSFWRDTRIDVSVAVQRIRSRNVLTDSICSSLNLSELFERCPVALLITT